MYKYGGIGGCTVSAVVVTSKDVIQINLGDSMSIIYDDKHIISISEVHKPQNEYVRIRQSNGAIVNGRLQGIYNLSRSLGDYDVKIYSNDCDKYSVDWMLMSPMSPVPWVKTIPRCPNMGFAICSDGVSDVVTDEGIVTMSIEEIVYNALKETDDDITIIKGLC